MKSRLAAVLLLVALGLGLAAAGCGSPATTAGNSDQAPAATSDAARGDDRGEGAAAASPSATAGQPGQVGAGKPVVYWVHTSW
ncbi:MAG: hypothetical protein HS107_14100 [Thermoflexaceae bacterium]|nr:hypothetical protein [Thermoflexaceae bacterium]